LIYEDDPTLRAVLTELLQDEGLVVRGFESIATLREVASKLRPALILTDSWGSSYTELEPHERAGIAELAALAPLILLTGKQWVAEVTAAELGVVCILPKPVRLEQLVEQIVNCVHKKSRSQFAPSETFSQAPRSRDHHF
jgi:DNA-binding NtrC family response regulator